MSANSRRDDMKSLAAKVAPAAALLSSNTTSLKHTIAATALLRHAISFEEFDKSVVDEIVMCLDDREDIAREVAAVKDSLDKEYVDANESFGTGCSNPGSFQGALHAMLTSNSYAECIRKIARAGGCNCSRANLAGACLGAVYGIGGEHGIPLEWVEKTEGIHEILLLALDKVAMPAPASGPSADSSEDAEMM